MRERPPRELYDNRIGSGKIYHFAANGRVSRLVLNYQDFETLQRMVEELLASTPSSPLP